MKHIYIAGLGAIGGAYGAILHKNGCESLRILVDAERFKRYGRDPIWVNDEPISFQYLVPDQEAPKADLILIACKFSHLNEVLQLVKPVVGENTLILPLLNGIDSERIAAKCFSEKNVLNALCFGIDSVRENGRIRYGNPGRIVFGEKDNTFYSDRVKKVAALFDKYGIPYEIPVDYEHVQWRKFMINVANNQTSAVMLANYGVFKDIPEAKQLMVMVMKEVIQIANAKGIALSQNDIDVYLELLPTFDGDGKSSTHQDMEASRKTEVDMFAGSISRMGDELGIETPLNDLLFLMIRTMEKMRGVTG